MHRHLELGVGPGVDQIDDVGVQRVALRVQMLDEVDQTTLVVECLGAGRLLPLIGQVDQ